MMKDYDLTEVVESSTTSRALLSIIVPLFTLVPSVLLFAYSVVSENFKVLVISCIFIIASYLIHYFGETYFSNSKR